MRARLIEPWLQREKKRKLSELMAIGFNFPKAFGSGEPRKYNGRYRQNCGATQRTDRPRDCWIGETTRRKMGRERGGSRSDSGGAGGGWWWRSSSGGRRENHFRGDLKGNGDQQDRRDHGSAQRGAGAWPGGSESACRRRAKDDQGRRDQSRSRRDEKENRSGGSEGRDQVSVASACCR